MVCEEFHCLPSQAIRELENDSEWVTTTVMSMRAFARAKHIYENAKSQADVPQNAMTDLVQEIEFEGVREEPDDQGGASS